MASWEQPLARFAAQLEAAWRRAGAPIADALAAGATPETLQALEEQAGLKVPPELVAWWSWHDGVVRTGEGPTYEPQAMISPRWSMLSATEAFAEHASRRSHAESPYLPRDLWPEASLGSDPHDWEGQWLHSWLPVFTLGAYVLYVDCDSVTPAGMVPVRYYDHTPQDVFTPVAVSFTALIGMLAYLHEVGVYSVGENGRWHGDRNKIPEFLNFQTQWSF
jgi:cell wall assembly regulator SMI1